MGLKPAGQAHRREYGRVQRDRPQKENKYEKKSNKDVTNLLAIIIQSEALETKINAFIINTKNK